MRFDNFDKYEKEVLRRVDRIKNALACSTEAAAVISISMELCYIHSEIFDMKDNVSSIDTRIDEIAVNLLHIDSSMESIESALQEVDDTLNNIDVDLQEMT